MIQITNLRNSHSVSSSFPRLDVDPNNERHGDWFLRLIGLKKKTHIRNRSAGLTAYIFVSGGPITQLKEFSVKECMSVVLDNKNPNHVQEFKLIPMGYKKIRVNSYKFHVTAFLSKQSEDGDEDWVCLWKNRMFKCSNDVNILDRHHNEATAGPGRVPVQQRRQLKQICEVENVNYVYPKKSI